MLNFEANNQTWYAVMLAALYGLGEAVPMATVLFVHLFMFYLVPMKEQKSARAYADLVHGYEVSSPMSGG